jgi:hypothetical protein
MASAATFWRRDQQFPEQIMPIVQGGPPEWTWERPNEKLKWEINRAQSPEGSDLCEVRIHCGLEIMRLQFFTLEEIEVLKCELKEFESGVGSFLPAERNA